jgi:hypothetical protein
MMKRKFFKDNNLTEEKIAHINRLAEEDELPEAPSAPSGDDSEEEDSASAESTTDLDTEEVNKIIDIFKKIVKQLESDSPEAEYVQGLISSLDSAKVKGIEDSKMKEIIDFLSSAKAPKKEDDTESEESDDSDDDENEEEVDV